MNRERGFCHLSWLLAGLVLIGLCACSGPSSNPNQNTNLEYWEVEDNDSSSRADLMDLNYRSNSDGYDYTGVISASDNSGDWFRLDTYQSGQLTVALRCNDLSYREEIYLTLFNANLNVLDDATLAGSSGGTVSVRTSGGAAPGNYYIRVSSDSWDHRYDLDPNFSSGGANFEYWEIEDNDNASRADELPLDYNPQYDGYDYTGVISAQDGSADWYWLETTWSGRLSVTLTCLDLARNEQITISMFDESLRELDFANLGGSPGGSITVSSFSFTPAGFYYVRVSADSWQHQYDLDPRFTQ